MSNLKRSGGRARSWAFVVGAGVVVSAGCGQNGTAEAPASDTRPAVVSVAVPASIPVPASSGSQAPPAAAATSGLTVAATASTTARKFDVTFDAATFAGAPDGTNPPPEKTLAGKSTAALRTALEAAWPTVSLTDAAGRPGAVTATVETAAGPIELTLNPEVAPNHVRNFLSLAKVGYFDGLVFERVVRQDVVFPDGKPGRIELVTAGCPLGEGAEGSGHIGYFLKPEPSDSKHEAGTVGFWRDADPNSAGVRFYITLGPVPSMDGEYTVIGKVSKGLDVVRTIAAAPVKDAAATAAPESEQPKEPVRIGRVARN